MSTSLTRWLLTGDNSRSTVALLHYFVVALVPLCITAVLFVYLDNNSATFNQQGTGIKLAGPIAAYVILVGIMKLLLKDVFLNLREEDVHRERLKLTELTSEDAIDKSEIFARLAADFCLMEMLSLRRTGHSKEHATFVTSVVRKNAYRMTKVLSLHTVHEGKYTLVELTTAAINNKEFIQELASFISEMFPDKSPNQRTPMFADLDIELARKRLANIIWRQCEAAIKDPQSALKKALHGP